MARSCVAGTNERLMPNPAPQLIRLRRKATSPIAPHIKRTSRAQVAVKGCESDDIA